jgi:hypothetical protein
MSYFSSISYGLNKPFVWKLSNRGIGLIRINVSCYLYPS